MKPQQRREDDADENRLGDAVERWAGAEDGRAVEHHVQRVLRQVDLGRLYRRLLQPDPDADPLQRALQAAEIDQQIEEIRRRIEALVAASLGDLAGSPPRVPARLPRSTTGRPTAVSPTRTRTGGK